jgi:hypothetical protein
MTTTLDTFTREWARWHEQQEARLADPHGFLAITSLNWLSPQPQRFPDAPGRWSAVDDRVTVELAADEDITVDGAVIGGRHTFPVIRERGAILAVAGDAVLEVAKRGGHNILRPRHPNNPLRLAFHGTPAYPAHPDWVVTGRYVAFAQPRPTTVGAAVEGLQHVYEAPGQVEFSLAGRALMLTAFNGYEPGQLMVLFTDATSGVTTYAANRSLRIPPPTVDGQVTLDFNRAVNLPCAYTDLATCPLPPAENRLPVAIEAGEQIPYERR